MTKSKEAKQSAEKKNCEYCGNNPVPHFVYWYFESLNLFLAPIRRAVLYNNFSLKIKKFFVKILPINFWLKIFVFFRVITFNTSIEQCKVSRAKVLWQEAKERGIEFKELLLFGRPFDVYEACYKLQAINYKLVFSGLPRPKNYDDRNLDRMDDKGWLKNVLLKNNLPVPLGGYAFSWLGAKKIFNNIQAKSKDNLPVIVKPRAGSRGRHSTIYIKSLEGLKRAYKIAKQLCFWVIVEEQLSGPVYRATLINFELCGVLRGDQPQVVGDGFHSIAQLVDIKNHRSHLGVSLIKLDALAENFLKKQGLSSAFVPQMGRSVILSEKIGVNYGGSSSEDFEICHPDNKDMFVRAAKIIGDPIVGFDFIIPDITKSYKQQRCGFIEANSLPFINLHHEPLLGRPRNVAAKVWDMVLPVVRQN